MSDSLLEKLLAVQLSADEIETILRLVSVDDAFLQQTGDNVPAAMLAEALGLILFSDLLKRVPLSKTYCEEQIAQGRQVIFDHGALRTVAAPMARLPSGQSAFQRILEPLGYQQTGIYPLEKLCMCGFVYTHKDYPETIPQYFVSELYPDRFSPSFQLTVESIVFDSKDPIGQVGIALLKELSSNGSLDLISAATLLPRLVHAFGLQHEVPTMAQYDQLLSESAEMAWISTEGNAFNHATDRVDDLNTLVQNERNKARPLKPQIEEGKNANIRQTAYLATQVDRPFRTDEGVTHMRVPGSFFEFIERGVVEDENGEHTMDLRFDSQNAQGIFKMTKA